MRYVDEVVTYTLESDLYEYLKDNTSIINTRFLGDDYVKKPFTGDDLPIKIHYINRDHGWSTTKFKKQIANEVLSSSNV